MLLNEYTAFSSFRILGVLLPLTRAQTPRGGKLRFIKGHLARACVLNFDGEIIVDHEIAH